MTRWLGALTALVAFGHSAEFSELAGLEALGYVDFGDPAGQGAGVELLETGYETSGYRLVTYGPTCSARLLDAAGVSTFSWQDPDPSCERWGFPQLMDDGRLVVPRRSHASARSLALLAPDGGAQTLQVEAHHGTDTDDAGNLVLLLAAQVDRGDVAVLDSVVAVPGAGLSISLLEVLAGASLLKETPSRPRDPIHANAVRAVGEGFLVTCRNQDLVVLLDRRGDVIWSWGPGQLEGPHDGQVTDAETVLIFDNGVRRGYSRIVEVALASGEIVWEYSPAGRERFYSATRGAVQRLPNGNTLIGISDVGEVREVDVHGRVLWRYRSEVVDQSGRVAAIPHVRWYPEHHPGVLPLTGANDG